MTAELTPGFVVAAATLALEHEPLPPEQVVSGSPTTGYIELDRRDGRECGVWEHTPGTSTDVEADELFVVIAGRATLRIDGLPDVELSPGSIMRLAAGMATTWVVRETLRKIYWLEL